MTGKTAPAERNVAIVGPYLSGKTSLLESLLSVCGAITRKGTIKEGTTVGDSAPESRARQMTVEVTAASAEFMGDTFTFLDCPGSIEFAQETFNALMGVDAAIVVCEPDLDRAQTLAPLLRFLDHHEIPRFIFVNKIDKATASVADLHEALQAVSSRPLVLRQVPIRDGEEITGYVDLASERAHVYSSGGQSEIVALPEAMTDRIDDARTQMLETLADFDDDLLEKLLEDEIPPHDEVFRDLTKDLQGGLIIPVFLGAAEMDNGVHRLLKALRHEVPSPDETAARRDIDAAGEGTLAQALKTYINPHSGKLTLVRLWRGQIQDGDTLNGSRVGGIYRLMGQNQTKLSVAKAGDIVALGRMEGVATGDTLAADEGQSLTKAEQLPPVFAKSVTAKERKDEVKLSGALQKLMEEDPSITVQHIAETGEVLLCGQGEIHLLVALDRLRDKYHIDMATQEPRVPYRETIRRPISQHGRFKRQSGGAGQFGDVHVDIKPVPRGQGFQFKNTVVGGAIPRQYIPAVEAGVREYMTAGPLGFPVVDIAVTLTDGSYHAVDSSEIAFKQAARIAMTEGMPQCAPILLEPIHMVSIVVPNEFTPKIQRLISGRRGQILGFDTKQGWDGWDEVQAQMPRSEIHDLIIELRSLTFGVGTYTAEFDHLQEITGREAELAIASAKEETH